MSAKEIFDKAVGLKEGQSLLIPCHDSRQQESLRVSLAYQRRIFLQSTDINFDIIASKITQGGKPFVSLTKFPRITTGLIVNSDGSVETTSLKADPISSIARDALDLNRIRQAMREDGISEEEIEAYISGQQMSKIDISVNECEVKDEGDKV